MLLKTSRLLRYLLPAIAMLGAAIGWSSTSEAFVNQIVIDSTNTANYNPVPLGSSVPSTTAVGYTIYTAASLVCLIRPIL